MFSEKFVSRLAAVVIGLTLISARICEAQTAPTLDNPANNSQQKMNTIAQAKGDCSNDTYYLIMTWNYEDPPTMLATPSARPDIFYLRAVSGRRSRSATPNHRRIKEVLRGSIIWK